MEQDPGLEVVLPDPPRARVARQAQHRRDQRRIDEEIDQPGDQHRNQVVPSREPARRAAGGGVGGAGPERGHGESRHVVRDADHRLALHDRLHRESAQHIEEGGVERAQEHEAGQIDHGGGRDVSTARHGDGARLSQHHEAQHHGQGEQRRMARVGQRAGQERQSGAHQGRKVEAEAQRRPRVHSGRHRSNLAATLPPMDVRFHQPALPPL